MVPFSNAENSKKRQTTAVFLACQYSYCIIQAWEELKWFKDPVSELVKVSLRQYFMKYKMSSTKVLALSKDYFLSHSLSISYAPGEGELTAMSGILKPGIYLSPNKIFPSNGKAVLNVLWTLAFLSRLQARKETISDLHLACVSDGLF